MANPFDGSVDESYNPFAAGYTESPPSSPPIPEPEPYAPAPAPAASPAAPKPGLGGVIQSAISTVRGGSTFVDPVTGVPVTERDIELREQELAKRERAIAEREQQVQSGTYQAPTTRNNFPPFLKWWAWHPDEDLPENSRFLAKLIFWLYLGYGASFCINLIGALACLGAGGAQKTSTGMLLALACVWFFVVYPVGYEVVYFMFYNSLISGKAVKYVCSMILYAIWWAILVVALIGIGGGGSVGMIIMINLYSGHKGGQGTIALIFFIAGTADALGLAYAFLQLIRFYKAEGLQGKAMSEVGQFAAQQAVENKDLLADAARENPELVGSIAANAYSTYG
jgi:hypothetical protein